MTLEQIRVSLDAAFACALADVPQRHHAMLWELWRGLVQSWIIVEMENERLRGRDEPGRTELYHRLGRPSRS